MKTLNRVILTSFIVSISFAILFGSLTFETVMAKPNSSSSADFGVCHFDNTDTQMWEALWVHSNGQMKAHVNVHEETPFSTDAEAAWCVANQDGTIVEPPSVCGDGVVTGSEECDDNNTNTETCDYNVMSCTVCASDCTEQSGATSYCGDNNIDGANGETCDDGVDNGSDTFCNLTCDGQTEYCGDTIVNGGEECDGSDLDGMTCFDLLFENGGSLACDSSCIFETTGCFEE